MPTFEIDDDEDNPNCYCYIDGSYLRKCGTDMCKAIRNGRGMNGVDVIIDYGEDEEDA